jgi:hypothetical protein
MDAKDGAVMSEKLAYLAGLFDGEGCVVFTRNGPELLSGGLQVSVTNTDLDLLERFTTQFGGRIRLNRALRRRPGAYRTTFAWVVCGGNAARVLETLRPFLVAKAPQADLALKIRATIPGQRADMLVQLKALKRVDHGGRFAGAQPEQETSMNTTRTFNTPARIQRVIDLYTGANGPLRSMDFIAKKYGTTTVSVRNALVANGVAIRGRGRVAQNA